MNPVSPDSGSRGEASTIALLIEKEVTRGASASSPEPPLTCVLRWVKQSVSFEWHHVTCTSRRVGRWPGVGLLGAFADVVLQHARFVAYAEGMRGLHERLVLRDPGVHLGFVRRGDGPDDVDGGAAFGHGGVGGGLGGCAGVWQGERGSARLSNVLVVAICTTMRQHSFPTTAHTNSRTFMYSRQSLLVLELFRLLRHAVSWHHLLLSYAVSSCAR
jgi:hypothetical protein